MSDSTRARTLRASLKDGCAYSLMQGFGERNIPPFATWLSTGEAAFGLLVSLSAFAGGVFQVIGANLADHSGRRKSLFVGGSIVQALSWGGVLLAIYAPPPWNVTLLIAAQVVYLGALHFTIPAWSSTMGDVVPMDVRGRYFGLRNFWCGGAQLLSFTASACLLDLLKPHGLVAQGFVFLFAGALLFRLQSVFYLTGMHEPPYAVPESERFTMAQFVRRAPHGNFGRFVGYLTALHFGMAMAGTFMGYFMLRDLGWSYTEFMVASNLQLLGLFASQPVWGRLADRLGNKRILAVGGMGIGLIPVFWLVSLEQSWLFGVQLFDGLVWGAFQLAAQNYLFDVVRPPKRARCMAYANFFAGAGLSAGALIGGFLWARLPAHPVIAGVTFTHSFSVLLALSAGMRLGAGLLLLPTFTETRVRPPEPFRDLPRAA